MADYNCLKCGKVVRKVDKTICPYCSGRILIKGRTSAVRELPAE
jgi:DNA-directed RNA polymerase subunit RPC12/RpoP